jgi:putative SOS response-associated peptidase YedK
MSKCSSIPTRFRNSDRSNHRDHRRADPSFLKALLAPFPSDEMTCWPVSARVGNVKNNDPSLIERIAA